MMYNLPKFDSGKATKNLKLTKANAVILHAHCPCFKNVEEATSTGGQTGSHTLRSNSFYWLMHRPQTYRPLKKFYIKNNI